MPLREMLPCYEEGVQIRMHSKCTYLSTAEVFSEQQQQWGGPNGLRRPFEPEAVDNCIRSRSIDAGELVKDEIGRAFCNVPIQEVSTKPKQSRETATELVAGRLGKRAAHQPGNLEEWCGV